MSGYFDPAPRDQSVAPPGYQGKSKSTTPFARHRAAIDRTAAQAWGSSGIQSGNAYVPTSSYDAYEPTTHANSRSRTVLPPSDPRSRAIRTSAGS